MKRHLKIALMMIASSTALFSLEPKNEQKIRSIIERYVHSWNHDAGHDFARDYSKDANFVNIFGMKIDGQKEIEKRHLLILDTFLKDSTFEVLDIQTREVRPDLVIAHVRWRVTGYKKPGSNEIADPMTGIFSHTFYQNDGRWEIICTQNTLDSQRD